MEQTNNNQKETAADRYAYSNEGDAFRQLWQQAEQGDLKAQKEVAYRIYLYVQECSDPLADCETMIRYLKNLASHGDEHAMFVLGETYYCGYEGVGLGRQDLEESVRWFKLAAQQGYPSAQVNLGDYYYQGRIVEQNYEKGIELYKKAAAQNECRAFMRIAADYVDRKADYKEAAKWYRKAANHGNWLACYRLGTFYQEGKGVKQSDKEAAKWFRKAKKLN